MLVEADAVVAELVQLLPGVEVLSVGPHRDLRLEVFLFEWPGQFRGAIFQMFQVLAIRQQIENKYPHERPRSYEYRHTHNTVRGSLRPGPGRGPVRGSLPTSQGHRPVRGSLR